MYMMIACASIILNAIHQSFVVDNELFFFSLVEDSLGLCPKMVNISVSLSISAIDQNLWEASCAEYL